MILSPFIDPKEPQEDPTELVEATDDLVARLDGKSYGSDATGSKYEGQRRPTPSRSYLNFGDDD